MIDENLLDTVLNFTKMKRIVGLIEEDRPEFTEEENKYLNQAFIHLEKDGYVYWKTKDQYLLSLAGLMALQERYLFMFRDKPYRRAKFKRAVNNVWQVTKIVAAVANAVILILLGWWALHGQ